MLPRAAKTCGLKNIWLTAQAALVIRVMFQAGMAAAQNLVTNPGFEAGNTSGWFNFGTPTLAAVTSPVHSGDYAALVTDRTATYMGIAQSLAGVLQTNVTYTVTAWLQLAGGTNATMQITAQQTDAGGTTYTEITSGTVTNGGWTQLAGQYSFTVNGTLTNLNIDFEMPGSATNAYYIDDVSITAPAAAAGTNGSCTVDWDTVFQRIDGFGASSAWGGSWTATQANMFFSTNASGTATSFDGRTNFFFNGCGLSLLRNHIAYAGSTAATEVPSTVETTIMQLAQARGARVWSAPWTPPAGFKSPNDIYDGLTATSGGINGGSYLGSGNNITNLNYARQLANYVASMKATGVTIYALSIQNEPDAQVNGYEACQWTGQQIHDFATNLYAALVAKGYGSTKIILPESENWSADSALFTPTLADTNASAETAILADHDYVADNGVGDLTIPAMLPVNNQAVWETEVSQFGNGFDGSITNALYWAGRIHLFMTAANANAWHYWWLVPANADNEGLTDTNGVPAKRMYALGQFARFIRPNFYRIKVTNNTSPALISAYKDSVSPKFAIVAINSTATNVSQVFNLTNVPNLSLVTPWLTSGTTNLSRQPGVTVTNGSFGYVLPALSIVTFAGQYSSNTPPVFSAAAIPPVNAGITLTLTNTASDTNQPPPALTYGLLSGPAGATFHAQSGVLTWRPTVAQANTSNNVVVTVADNGAPPLRATNSFAIVVNPLTNPVLGGASVVAWNFLMTLNGPYGPDYTILTSSNLINWQTCAMSNQPVLPFTFTDTNPAAGTRFYKVQIGP